MSAAMDKARRIPRRIECVSPGGGETVAEIEKAEAWTCAWTEAWNAMSLANERPAKRWAYVNKRLQWAEHRWERAERAALPPGPRCWFCERPGHDESESSCPERRVQAWCWAWDGMKRRGKEGA